MTDRRCRHLASHAAKQRQDRAGVETMSGKGGSTVYRIGSKFDSLRAPDQEDPTPSLLRELEAQKHSRQPR